MPRRSSANVKVDGLRRLRGDLKAAAGNLDKLKTAYQRAAALVAGIAGPRAPHRTGRLAASVRGNNAASKAVVSAGGASVPYAGPVHWGWPAHNIVAQPFIAAAAQDSEALWLPAFEDDVSAALEPLQGRTY
jgi:hypothetical protein